MIEANRRLFLLTIGGAGAAISVAAIGWRMWSDLNRLDPQLEALIAAGSFSPDIGQKYLEYKGLPENLDMAFLNREVMEGLPRRSSDLHPELRRKIGLDFASNRVCTLDGWQLSATECRLAALAFLFREGGGHIEEPIVEPDGPISGLPEGIIAQVENWGPRSALAGEGFNLQPGGNSALYFHFAEVDRHSYEVCFGMRPLRTTVNVKRNLVSATVTKSHVRELMSKPGEIPIHLVDPLLGKQLVGHFRVRPKTISADENRTWNGNESEGG